jgi:hypothetical protein
MRATLPATSATRALAWAAAGALAAIAACSTTSSGGAGADAGPGPNQGLDQPCDPSLASPCLPSANPCAAISCDSVTKTCVQNVGAAPSCQSGGPEDAASDGGAVVGSPCTSASDCDGGEVCGFTLLEGCSATGTCVVASAPELPDGGPELACSCDGVNVPYVGAATTAAPVASPLPCLDAGQDASEDSGLDAGADASSDAGDAQ